MRVISGKYKGRKLEGFNIDGTRPTMDRVKESLFASIQNFLPNSHVLDLFAGSGSLGIEALSNGAMDCVFVDHSKTVCSILKENTKEIDNVTILHKDYRVALDIFRKENKKFDLILLDPPYKLNLINECLKLIYEYQLLSDDGIIVCEYESEEINCDYFEVLKNKKYANKCIRIYQRVK